MIVTIEHSTENEIKNFLRNILFLNKKNEPKEAKIMIAKNINQTSVQLLSFIKSKS